MFIKEKKKKKKYFTHFTLTFLNLKCQLKFFKILIYSSMNYN